MNLKLYFNLFKDFLSSNIIKTIYLNFRLFPVKVALKLPIFLYGRASLRSLNGIAEIRSHVFPGMIKMGINEWYVVTSPSKVVLTINGKLIFNGPIRFLQGLYITVSRKGVLEFGTKGTLLGSDTKIMCFEKITIGDSVRVAWNTQFYDTSFHYIERLGETTSGIGNLTDPIIIGNRVWIANNNTISKGSIIPDDTIVASHSLVNKDFSGIEPFSMIAGIPSKVKSQGLRRLWDSKRETELDEFFGYDRTHL